MFSIIVAIAIAFLSTSFSPASQSSQVCPQAEVLVPVGMPMETKIERCRDSGEASVGRYVVKRIVPANARGAMFLLFMVGTDGKVVAGSEMRFPSYRLSDPMTLASADKTVSKILVVVEWLETDGGKWVLDSTSPRQAVPEEIAKHGAKALPKAVFVKSN